MKWTILKIGFWPPIKPPAVKTQKMTTIDKKCQKIQNPSSGILKTKKIRKNDRVGPHETPGIHQKGLFRPGQSRKNI